MKNIDGWLLVLSIASILVPTILIVWGINALVDANVSWIIGFDIALGGYLLGRVTTQIWK